MTWTLTDVTMVVSRQFPPRMVYLCPSEESADAYRQRGEVALGARGIEAMLAVWRVFGPGCQLEVVCGEHGKRAKAQRGKYAA